MSFPQGFAQKVKENFPKDEKLKEALRRGEVDMVKFILGQHAEWPDAVDDVLEYFKKGHEGALKVLAEGKKRAKDLLDQLS